MKSVGRDGGPEKRDDRVPSREIGGSFFRLGQTRTRMGGASLAFLLLAAPGIGGCTGSPRGTTDAPRIDMSTEESAARTMESLQKSLTPQQLNDFNQATRSRSCARSSTSARARTSSIRRRRAWR